MLFIGSRVHIDQAPLLKRSVPSVRWRYNTICDRRHSPTCYRETKFEPSDVNVSAKARVNTVFLHEDGHRCLDTPCEEEVRAVSW